ncbi:hypothetical protein SUGI_0769630 [Cryptomeria japonica]|nr:hypothetical protein SUGI_0769630 [Cryptomeria japonica]
MDGVELRRLINLTAVISRKALAKSRDPRRRVTESEFCTVDLNTQPCQIESSIITKEQAEEVSLDRKHKADADLIEDCNHKRQRNLSAHHLFPNNFPVMMSRSGAWLEENTVIPSSSDWDQTLEMEVDSTGTIIRPNDLQSDYNSISDADIEDSIIENGNLNKRLKTESFYQANVAVGPAYESNQLQSNPIDVNSISIIIPSVLKDIAVNPTMLMSLLKNAQESFLSTQAVQKTEQYEEKNPPVVSTGELVQANG